MRHIKKNNCLEELKTPHSQIGKLSHTGTLADLPERFARTMEKSKR